MYIAGQDIHSENMQYLTFTCQDIQLSKGLVSVATEVSTPPPHPMPYDSLYAWSGQTANLDSACLKPPWTIF